MARLLVKIHHAVIQGFKEETSDLSDLITLLNPGMNLQHGVMQDIFGHLITQLFFSENIKSFQ
jgi:hypothetical protein